MKFYGYRRSDGTVGIRNHVLILATVNCAFEVSCKAAQNVLGAVSFVNPNGCGESSQNLKYTQDVLLGMACNPNVYGVVVVGLGCEINSAENFVKMLRSRTDKPVKCIVIQDEGGTINATAAAAKAAAELVVEASKHHREGRHSVKKCRPWAILN